MSAIIIKLALIHHYYDIVIVLAFYKNSVSSEGLGHGNTPQCWEIDTFFPHQDHSEK